MMKELMLSVASGVIVALILQMFRFGGRSEPPRQAVRGYAPTPSRRSSGGGLFRFILSVVGGIFLAFAAAPVVLGFMNDGGGGRGPRGRFFDGGGGGSGWHSSRYYDSPDRFDGIFGLPPMLVLTIIGTILVWALLSAMRRR